MHKFDCERCHAHVVVIVGDPHPENVLCLTCRFIESLENDEDKEVIEKFLQTHGRSPNDHDRDSAA